MKQALQQSRLRREAAVEVEAVLSEVRKIIKRQWRI
jgi:hypothetical protein